jgi:crotonobetainyl-CoA:carnitine CoA-transferase CaiB-like acyl-CoA transferase
VGEQATYFVAVNRNKQSVVIDLQQAAGKEALARLIAWADVLIENFRPGVLERLGFSDERLRGLNPALIVCSISGYGQTGPYRERRALDLIGQTMSGLASLTGDPDGPPTPAGAPVSDVLTGLNACVGILGALASRSRGGSAEYTVVDVSLLASTVSMLSIEATAYLNTGKVPRRQGGAWFEMFPYDVFPTSDGWIAVGSGQDWPKLCELLGLEELAAEAELVDMAARLERRAELKALLSEAFRARTTDEWLALLQAEDILSGPVYNLAELLQDEAAEAAGLAIRLDHPVTGGVATVRSGFRFQSDHDGTPVAPAHERPVPLLGEHTLQVLREVGFDEEEALGLCEQGVVEFLPA